MDCDLTLLYSGSTGNAALLRAGGTAVLIDAGGSARALRAALRAAGTAPEALSAVFLTHEHRDHTAALERFLCETPLPVHVVEASAARLLGQAGPALAACVVPHPPLFSVTVDGVLACRSFPTPHDSAACVGYRFTLCGANGAVGYATDLGAVTDAVAEGLLGCGTVVLECNHDEDMLRTGPYPRELKRRVASRRGHLSNADCARFAARLAEAGMKRLMLAHLSETNNLPELAIGEVAAALAGSGVEIAAAKPDAPVRFEVPLCCASN